MPKAAATDKRFGELAANPTSLEVCSFQLVAMFQPPSSCYSNVGAAIFLYAL